jgi:NTP pyrophosphatase (non-canonical NTP hydrolase)
MHKSQSRTIPLAISSIPQQEQARQPLNIYDDYASFTERTAIYPQQVAAEYLALGLCSETSECQEELTKLGGKNLTHAGNEIGGEAGDVVWYIARLAVTYNFDFNWIVDRAKKDYYAHPFDIDAILVLLSIDSGLIAGKIKKQLRDGHTWTGEQREDARQHIGDRLSRIVMRLMQLADWMYANHCSEYGTFDKIMNSNRKKLESRAERGTLRGDGNTR